MRCAGKPQFLKELVTIGDLNADLRRVIDP
jgi:hypothetical protein